MLRFFLFLITASVITDLSAAEPEIKSAAWINKDSLHSYISVLTSDSLQGRETGKPGQKKAARYLRDSFMKFGLYPLTEGGMQIHALSAKSNKDKNMIVDEKKYVYWNDFFSFSCDSDTPLSVDNTVLLDYARLRSRSFHRKLNRMKDKRTAVLVTGFPDTLTGTVKSGSLRPLLQNFLEPLLVHANHPEVVLIQCADFEKWAQSSLSAEQDDPVFRQFVRGLPFRLLLVSSSVVENSFRSSAGKKIRKSHTAVSVPAIERPEELLGENIPFVVTGSEKPDEYVCVTAHYDHLGVRGDTVFYGADDDASGTSAVTELARVFALAAADGNRPRRSILFMPVSGEEKGLLGSRYYSENPLVPLAQTVAEVNIDMIGRIDPEHDSSGIKEYIYVIGSDKLSTELHAINEKANEEHVGLKLDYRYNVPGEPNRFYFRSDHYNFARHGVPSIFYFNGKHADYHKASDTMDKIDLDVMEKRTRLIFHTVWELANRPDRIVVDRTNDMEVKRSKPPKK